VNGGKRNGEKIHSNFRIDIDPVAGWIGSCGGGDSPSDIDLPPGFPLAVMESMPNLKEQTT
jgi:hypothetical protein